MKGRKTMFFVRALVVALSFCLAPSLALAASFPIADRSGGLRLDVYTWDGRPCIVNPEQGDRAACLPSDPTTAPISATAVEVVSSAVVHFEGWDLGVLATRIDARTSTPEGIDPDDMLAASRKAVRMALPTTATLLSDGISDNTPVQQASGVLIVRVTPTIETTLASGAHGKVAAVEYIVCAARGVYEIAFVADAAHAADVAKVADNAVATLVAVPPVRGSGNVVNRGFYWLGRLVVFAVVAGFFVLFRGLVGARKRRAG
jgi:hypothetical protein